MTTRDHRSGTGLLVENPLQWGPGVRHAPEESALDFQRLHRRLPGLCTMYWIHAYSSWEHAVLHCVWDVPYAADQTIWESEGEVGQGEGPSSLNGKVGCHWLQTNQLCIRPWPTEAQWTAFCRRGGCVGAWETSSVARGHAICGLIRAGLCPLQTLKEVLND